MFYFIKDADFDKALDEVFKEFNKKTAKSIDRYYYRGLQRLSDRKKRKIKKWIYKVMKNYKEEE